jgi:hypothetical protein
MTTAKPLTLVGDHRPPAIINRISLEDMRELWYWGPWKEPVPMGFDTCVTIVCTSRQKCLAYKGIQMHDDFLLDDDDNAESRAELVESDSSTASTTQVPSAIEQLNPPEGEGDIFDEGKHERPFYKRRFRLLSFKKFLAEVQEEVDGWRDITLIVNPRESSTGEFTADAILRAEEFLRDLGNAGLARGSE